MTINSIGKSTNMVIFNLIILGVGVLMLIGAIVYLAIIKRRMNKDNEKYQKQEKENEGD